MYNNGKERGLLYFNSTLFYHIQVQVQKYNMKIKDSTDYFNKVFRASFLSLFSYIYSLNATHTEELGLS